MAASDEGPEGLVLTVPPHVLDVLVERVVHRLESSVPVGAEPWVGVEDAARHLGCRRQRIYDLVSRRGRHGIPHRKDGARLLFRLSEIDAWLEPGRR
ncbi:MAG: helix-turn-helix protein [Conexibacter sp.]|nr:helix-turn-helix protein [Conexibacter sp.]